MSNGFIRLCSMVFCSATISACHALLSSHMTNKDDDDDDKGLVSVIAPLGEYAPVHLLYCIKYCS